MGNCLKEKKFETGEQMDIIRMDKDNFCLIIVIMRSLL